MKFTKTDLIEILNKNFGYSIINDKTFGKLIQLDAQTAYRFCLTTNSNYLIDKYGLCLFGRLRTFNHRNLSLNQGLFLLENKTGEIIDNNLPMTLFRKYPFIPNGDKKIIFIEGKNTSEIISETYNQLIEDKQKCEDYIINVVNNNGAQWEHYFEYMASETFIKKGYLTDIQLPWDYHGRPDFGIYKHQLIDDLKGMRVISNGALIPELSAIRAFYESKGKAITHQSKPIQYEMLVGEVKTKQIKSQILDYLKKGFPIMGYEFIPNKKNSEAFCGLINIDENNKIQIKESPINPEFDTNKAKSDLEWFNCYLKIHLLGNLELPELRSMMNKNIKTDELNFINLIKLVKKVDILSILGVVKHGL